MSTHLLLVHGWGLGAGIWRPFLRALPHVHGMPLDLGFFGHPKLEIPTEHPFIAVGHSLGFLWLLQQLHNPLFAKSCQGLISINGFSCFTRRPNLPCGVAQRVLERMATGLRTDPVNVLTAFQRQGGLTHEMAIPATIHIETLLTGLSWLDLFDGREALAGWSGKVWALACEDDQIVPPTMTRALFQAKTIHWVPKGGHLILLNDPARCAAFVRESLQ